MNPVFYTTLSSVAPQVSLNFGPNIVTDNIREGSDVYLECHIKANPWIKEVLWLFDSKPLLTSQSSGIIVTNQSLVLQKVRRQHSGRYQCMAFNIEGDSLSDAIDLKVKCKANSSANESMTRSSKLFFISFHGLRLLSLLMNYEFNDLFSTLRCI